VKDGTAERVVVTTITDVRCTVEMAADAGPYCGSATGLGAARLLVMNSAERSEVRCMVDGVLEKVIGSVLSLPSVCLIQW
jgi:hypothetical protein